jgi:CheY-like chemotaxis protein
MKNKILFIEDDQIFGNVYRNKLLGDGFEAEVAYDGETGLDALRQFRPDAILLDLILPRMTGLEVLRKIRKEPDFGNLPIVVFTNTYLSSMVQEAWKAGATKCLAKADCSPREVLKTLHSILDGKGAATDAAAPALAATNAAGTEHSITPVIADDQDEKFQAELRKDFLDTWPGTLSHMRLLLQSISKVEVETLRVQQVHQLYRRIHALTGNASIVGMMQIAHMASALEALLIKLHDKPNNINASTLRTIGAAVDVLGVLFSKNPVGEHREFTVLVVDDEVTSRRAIAYALEKAKLKSVSLGEPLEALQILSDRKFDLIFLDVDMPEMNGYELCSRLRALPAYSKTPVVFVTCLNDLESRTNSTMSGGTDVIAKPFLFMELAVKALVYVVRGQWEAEPVPI